MHTLLTRYWQRALLHALLLPAIVFTASGCGDTAPLTIAGGDSHLIEGECSAAYLDRISTDQLVTQNDAFRGILLLLDGEDRYDDFASRVKALESRGVVSRDWQFGAQEPLTRGKMAYIIYRACEIKGALTLRIFGPSQRYCLKELQYRQIILKSSLSDHITGLEYVAVLGRADCYIRLGCSEEMS